MAGTVYASKEMNTFHPGPCTFALSRSRREFSGDFYCNF